MLVGEVFARMGLDCKQYEKDLSRLEGVTRREATTLGAVFKNAFSVALGIGVFEAVKRGFQTIAGTAISFNAQMEQARIGFTTMLGSAERAEVFLRDMAEFAARTPFEFPELLDASKRMLAYGFAAKDVLPTMEAVGNASAAVGLGTEGINRIILALGQMRAKGKLSAEEMRQLTETGIPAWEILAEAMNKTTAEIMDMQQKGLIPAHEAIQILIEGMNKRFPDMMAQMENTWEGVTSTIKDVWRMTIGAMTSGLFQGLTTWLQGVRDWAVDFYDTFQKYGLQRAIFESFGPEVAALVSVLGAVMRGLASIVKAATGFFVQYGKQIKFVAIVMGTYLALTRAVTLAKQIMIAVTAAESGQLLAKIPILNVVSTAMGIYRVQMALAAQQGIVLTGVIAKLRLALFSLWSALGPIGWIILGLSAAVGVGTHLWGKYTQSVYSGAKIHEELAEGADQAGKSASDATGAIEDEVDALKKAGKAASKNLQSFDEVHQLQEDMAGSAEDLAKSMGLDDTELGVPDAGGFEIPGMGAQLEEMKPTLAGFWEWIKRGAGKVWDSVKQKWNSFINWIKSWDVWNWLAEKWNGLKNIAQTYWDGITKVISTAWNGIVNVTKTVWQETSKLLKTYWNSTAKLASDVFGAIRDYVVGTWDNVKNTAISIWGAIWGFLKSQWETTKNFGSNIFGILRNLIIGKIDLRAAISLIWNEIKAFFLGSWTNIKDFGINIWTALGDFFQSQWGLIHGLAVATWTAIKGFLVGNWEATKGAAVNIWTAIRGFFNETWEAIKTAAIDTWTAISEFLGINWEATRQKALEIWSDIKKTISDKWNELKEIVGPIWNEIKIAIADKWREIKDDAFNWGKNLISSFVEGIKNKINSVKSTLRGVGRTIKNFLGFSSPTKEGPGRFADEWAPSLMSMFAEGQSQNIPMVRRAVDEVAKRLTGMTVQPTVQQSVVSDATVTGGSGLEDMPEMPEMPEMPKIPTMGETGFLEKISDIYRDVAGGISTGISEASVEFRETLEKAWRAFKSDWQNIFDFFTWSNIKQKFVDGWTGFQSWFSQTWAGQIWDKVKIKWQEVREEFMWANIKQMFVDGWTGFQSWFSQTWAGKIWDGVKQKWDDLKTNAPETWEDIKESIRTRWEKLKKDAPETWDNIKKSIAERWEMLKKDAPETWENIKKTIAERWEKLKIDAPSVWENIKKEISNRWETLKIDAPIVWENIKKGISERWEALRTSAPTTWEEIRKNISDRWEALKTDAPTAWGNIRKSIGDKWEELKTNAPITWEEIKKEITDRWEALKTDAPTAWEDIAGSLKRIWEGIKETAGDIWDSMTNDVIKGAINGIIDLINRLIDMWNSLKFEVPSITIGNKTFGGYTVRVPQIDPITPLAKGGLVTAPTLAMIGEAGPEAVVPLGRSGFAEDLADTVAQAVYRAVMDAVRISQASAGGGDREIVLKIDNTTLARMQLPAIIREGQRQGLDLVVRPQGV